MDSINLGFFLREKLAAVLIIPSSWGSQLDGEKLSTPRRIRVWAKGEASKAARLCRRPLSLTTCRKGRATTCRGHHAMLAGGQIDPSRKAANPGPDVPVDGRKEPELKLSIRGRRPGLPLARST
jgi:hypothetical protein